MNAREILRKIRRIQLRTSHRVDDLLSGSWNSVFKGRGIEFEEVRPYQIGDDVRAIDWNVTARSDQPYVKLFRAERELSVWILMDVSPSLAIGTRDQTKRELLVELGATIAMSAIKNNDQVGLMMFSDQMERSLPARSGSRHALRLIREMLLHQPSGRGTDVRVALDHLHRVVRHRTLVFLISDFQCADFERPLRIASRRHDVIPVMVQDAIELELPNIGLVRVRDAESGQVVLLDTANRRHREAYATLRAVQISSLESMFRRLRLSPLQLQTGEDLTRTLQRYFRT